MKVLGHVIVALGLLCLIVAINNASQAPNLSFFVGTCLPGIVIMIIGLALAKERKAKSPARADQFEDENMPLEVLPVEPSDYFDERRLSSFRFKAGLGVVGGIIVMAAAAALAKERPPVPTTAEALLPMFISLIGWAWLILGCVNYMRWKGRSGWFGLFGYLFLPGLIVLACLPNRRKRLEIGQQGDATKQINELIVEDRKSGFRFQLGLIPFVVFFFSAWGLLSWRNADIDSAEWKLVAPEGMGFQLLMPGTPELTKEIHETPVGNVEIHKFMVNPKGKNELFMIIVFRVPEFVKTNLGGKKKLLELGGQDLVAASHGKLIGDWPMLFHGYRGLDIEIYPPDAPKGLFIRGKVIATRTEVYQISAHVPINRLRDSSDVGKFLESFKLLCEPGTDRPWRPDE